MGIGIFPLTCYENDSMYMIAGGDVTYHQGWQLPPILAYEYDTQPMIHIITGAVKYLIPFLSCENIYCLLSAICCFIFLAGCLRFVHMTFPQTDKWMVLFATVLLPESYAAAMYPNSAIFAAALYIWALLLIQKKRFLYALPLLVMAPLCRVDIVIVYPAILPLLYLMGYSFKRSFFLSAMYAIGVLTLTPLLLWAVGANPIQSYLGYQSWNEVIKNAEVLIAIFGYYVSPG